MLSSVVVLYIIIIMFVVFVAFYFIVTDHPWHHNQQCESQLYAATLDVVKKQSW